jgi:hypothetical protein
MARTFENCLDLGLSDALRCHDMYDVSTVGGESKVVAAANCDSVTVGICRTYSEVQAGPPESSQASLVSKYLRIAVLDAQDSKVNGHQVVRSTR